MKTKSQARETISASANEASSTFYQIAIVAAAVLLVFSAALI